MSDKCDATIENADDCTLAHCELPPHDGEWHFASTQWVGPEPTDYVDLMWKVVPDPFPEQRR